MFPKSLNRRVPSIQAGPMADYADFRALPNRRCPDRHIRSQTARAKLVLCSGSDRANRACERISDTLLLPSPPL
jgi:hypothetical protein